MKRSILILATIFLMATATDARIRVAPMIEQLNPCVAVPCYTCEADMRQIIAFYNVEYDSDYCAGQLAAITHCLRHCPQCTELCADWITDYVSYGCDPK